MLITALTAATTLVLPAAAQAASATITGDTGQPLALSPTVTQIRNMSPVVTPAFESTEKRYAIGIVGPDGKAAASTGTTCIGVGFASGENVKYLGNGDYTVAIATSTDASDTRCERAGKPQIFRFRIEASTSVTAPAPRLLTRRPGESQYLRHAFGVGVNPGADSIEVRYARGATLAPDGGIAGDPSRASVDTASGVSEITFFDPGTYTFVSRAVDFATNAATAWSPPVTVRVLAPFDLVSKPFFADSLGPRYKITGTVRDKTASGRIRVYVASGRKGGRFHKAKTIRISRSGRFTYAFTQRRRGVYRIRYRFDGSKTIAGGYVQQAIKITRR
jgi:hypothetical protein